MLQLCKELAASQAEVARLRSLPPEGGEKAQETPCMEMARLPIRLSMGGERISDPSEHDVLTPLLKPLR